ncbi:hypothetical protein A2U01_0091873, partial [Trifolium medium]|nr:hypothetical protein [Trifolium medium]
KEPGEIRVERSLLASDVVKKGIMPMSVEFPRLIASTVRSRAILLEIAVLQKWHRRRVQLREVDPPPKDVSTAWARK